MISGVEKRLSETLSADDTIAYEEYDVILCPACGYEYSHIQRAGTKLGTDKYEARVYEGTEALGCVGWRRSALVVELKGECGHQWALVIQQHKGINYVRVEAPDQEAPKEWLGAQE